MEEAVISVIQLILRIIVVTYCVIKAGKLNRSKFGWGVFALFLPIIALIVIFFMKPVVDFENVKTAA